MAYRPVPTADLELDEASASEVIENKFIHFSGHQMITQIPDAVDGLKQGGRRAVEAMGVRDELLKVPNLVGQVMEKHPHGDSSIADTIIRLTMPYADMVPLIEGRGNLGTYSGEEPSDARYLEVTTAAFTKDVFFDRVNPTTLVHIPCETGRGTEVAYYVPIVPFALMTCAMGIMPGYRTDTLAIPLKSLCDATTEFIELKAKNDILVRSDVCIKLARHLLPDWPVPSHIRNSREVIRSYATGDFTPVVIHDGILEIHPTVIIIRSLPYGRSFVNVKKMLLAAIVEKDGFIPTYFQRIDDFSKEQDIGQIECVLKRGVSPFTVLEQLKKMVGFTGNATSAPFYISPEREMTKYTPIDLLEVWFHERYRSLIADLKHTQQRLVNHDRELEAKMKALQNLDETIRIFRASPTKEAATPLLEKALQITQYQAKFLATLSMAQITGKGIEDILKDRETNKADIVALQSKFLNVHQLMIDDIQFIKRKYAVKYPRKATVPEPIGVLAIDGEGLIQFETMEELIHLEKRFDGHDVTVTLYPTGSHHKHLIVGEQVIGDDPVMLPMTMVGRQMSVAKHTLKWTICHRGNTIYRLEGLHARQEQDIQFVHTGDMFTAITRKGVAHQVPATSMPLRKAVVCEGNLTDYIYVSGTVDDQVIVVHANTSQANTLRIEKIRPNDKIVKIPVGTTEILGIYRSSDPFCVTVPDTIRSRCPVRHLLITPATLFSGTETSVQVFLGKRTVSNGLTINPIRRESTIYTVKPEPIS